jgi:hypothetical protein
MVMTYFAMTDQCQNLGRFGYSTNMTLRGMRLIESEIRKAITEPNVKELFEKLEQIYFPQRIRNE